MSTDLGEYARPFLLTLARVTQAGFEILREAVSTLTSISFLGPIFRAFHAEIARARENQATSAKEEARARLSRLTSSREEDAWYARARAIFRATFDDDAF